MYFSNTNVQSKAALAVSAFTCDADARAEVGLSSFTLFKKQTSKLTIDRVTS